MPNSVLENMKVNSTFQVDGFDAASAIMTEQLARVNEEITAMEGVLDLRAVEMEARLVIKKAQLGGDSIVYGPLFNVHGPIPTSGNIVDWHIDLVGAVIYEFEGIGWDSDSTIIDLNNKWDWTSVYLYQPVGLTGSFGLVPKKEQLEASIEINDANKTQIEQTNNMLP